MNEEDHVKGYLFGLIMIPIIIFLTWLFVWPPVYAADTKVTDMTAETAPAAADIMYLIKSPGGAGTDRQATVGNLTKGLTIANFPASANVVSLLGAADYADFRTLLGVTTGGSADNLIFGSDARGDMAVRGATVYGRVALGVVGKIWVAGATDPGWSAYTLAAPGAAGGILQSDNTNWARVTSLTGLTFGGFTASAAGMVPLTDASGNLVNSYLKFTGPASSMKTYTLPNESVTVATSSTAQTLNFVTTGTISGKIPMITKSDNYTLGTDNAQEAYGYMVWMSGANKTLTLPAVAAGMSVCLYSTDAEIKRVDPNSSDGLRMGAARDTDGDAIASTAAIGAFVCLVADSADGWTVLGKSGTWTAE